MIGDSRFWSFYFLFFTFYFQDASFHCGPIPCRTPRGPWRPRLALLASPDVGIRRLALLGTVRPITRARRATESYFGQAARSFAAISLYSGSGSFLLGAGVPGAFPPKEGMTWKWAW